MDAKTIPKRFLYKIGLIAFIQVVLFLTPGLRLGGYLEGIWSDLYYSYFFNFIFPFGFYFLLCLNEHAIPILRKWKVKFLFVIIVCILLEILQYYGIYILGMTFDPYDILVFAFGTLTAVFIDKIVFTNLLWFWKTD